MNPTALILQTSKLDTQAFLAVSIEMLGYSPARSADAQHMDGMAYELSCLTAFKDTTARPGVKEASSVYELFSVGVLILADERDMPEILEASAMPFALTETISRGIQSAFVSGTLRQWRTAVIKGCSEAVPQEVRICYDTIYLQFRSIGLDAMFERSQRTLNDNTFLLE